LAKGGDKHSERRKSSAGIKDDNTEVYTEASTAGNPNSRKESHINTNDEGQSVDNEDENEEEEFEDDDD
jgi:hypothetical protein